MLKQLRIQNFKSIRDVTLNLESVNLFIGPNNSGKSNILKALEFFSSIILNSENLNEVKKFTFNRRETTIIKPCAISLLFEYGDEKWLYVLNVWDGKIKMEFVEFAFYLGTNSVEISNIDILNIETWGKYFKEGILNSNSEVYKNSIARYFEFGNEFNAYSSIFIRKNHMDINYSKSYESYIPGIKGSLTNSSFLDNTFSDFLRNLFIYKPELGLIKHPIKNKENLELEFLDANCYNLAEFIFNFSQNHKKNYNDFILDFKKCVHEFEDISTPYDPSDNTKTSLKLKFFDKKGEGYWIDEVSDGVIYFLALLAIIHQPNPPKVLLLEEPETGIHPRRIKEIVDYIFKLADEKSIQIILTSHSPLVLNKFNSTPQSVNVFDKENGETKVKNLKVDIIDVSNDEQNRAGVPEINYTSSLSDYWIDGFIGGIPDEND